MASSKQPAPKGRPNPAKGSLLGQSNQPTPPTPWPMEGIRPYGGPDQPQGQPKFAPKGK